MLAWLNVHPVVEQWKLAEEIGPVAAFVESAAEFQNPVGVATGWVTRYMQGAGKPAGTSVEDRLAVMTLARRYWVLRNALSEVRQGSSRFRIFGSDRAVAVSR